MRKKIAKRRRKELLRRGVTILAERYVAEPGWKKYECGYGLEFEYAGHRCVASGRDRLEAYHDARDLIDWLDAEGGE